MRPIKIGSCETRPIRDLEVSQPDGWRMKVYCIAYEGKSPKHGRSVKALVVGESHQIAAL